MKKINKSEQLSRAELFGLSSATHAEGGTGKMRQSWKNEPKPEMSRFR